MRVGPLFVRGRNGLVHSVIGTTSREAVSTCGVFYVFDAFVTSCVVTCLRCAQVPYEKLVVDEPEAGA